LNRLDRGERYDFFMTHLLDVEYVKAQLLAPTQPMLDAYKKKGSWPFGKRRKEFGRAESPQRAE